MLESVIEKKVCDFAASRGWLVRKMKYIGRVGCPDRLFIRDGRVLFVEFKAPGKKPEGIQEHEIKRLRLYGAVVRVIDSVEDGVRLLQ